MEHIEDDALDDDALSRLGVEEYPEPEPQSDWTAALGATQQWLDAVHGDGNSPITVSAHPAIAVDGQANIDGDLHVTGNLVFDTTTSQILTFDGDNWINTTVRNDLEMALSRIEQLEHEIVMLRSEILMLSEQGESNE